MGWESLLPKPCPPRPCNNRDLVMYKSREGHIRFREGAGVRCARSPGHLPLRRGPSIP